MRPSRSAFTFATFAFGFVTLAGSLAPLGCETAASAPADTADATSDAPASDAAPDRAVPPYDAGCPIVNDASTLDCTRAIDAGDAGACAASDLDPSMGLPPDAGAIPVGCTLFIPMPSDPSAVTSPYTCVMRQCFCGTGVGGAVWACGL